MHSLRQKLLLFILPLCLTPLIGISIFSYYQAKKRITEDRIVLYLEQIAVDIADTIRLTLLEKTEETISMSLYSEFRDYLLKRTTKPPQVLLDQLVAIHEVYDVLALFDIDGNLLLTNSINRNRIEESLDPEKLKMIRGQKLVRYTPDSSWLQQVRSGHFGYVDWYASELIRNLYGYYEQDIAYQYGISFATPIMDERGVVVGGILALMSWQYIQEILDKVEEDFEQRSLSSGYAFLFGSDRNTIIGHKYRRNRNYHRFDVDDVAVARDNYGLLLDEDLQLNDLREALLEGATHFRYQYPAGTAKISGLAPINHEFFEWMCGVGINDEDIFAPVQDLLKKLIWVASLSAIAVVMLTFSVARQITIPLKKLTLGASVIAGGDLTQRVEVSSQDEIGELAKTFNEMAQSLEERSRALVELNKKLEEKVRERTRELEETNQQVREAYQELKQTQVQLIQSEKMASLGQLVAGIGHEIKNPLNFIYGNTDFLRAYIQNLKQLIKLYESEAKLKPEGVRKLGSLKKEMNYSFMLEDLNTLIRNFEEGAKRIHSVITDLKTFSRMDSDQFQSVNIHEPIDLALNLLHNEYRDRIDIHKEYGDVPRVECHPGKISQVFMNLLANACQAIGTEGDIWIRTFSEDGMAVVEIEDSGVGIEQEHLGKIFEPFFTTKSVGKGTGLGLSISYSIIQQHQGEIRVESQREKGTKFSVRLPLSPA
ncbi:ATP-binding protein [Acidobacteria bacterium AH-259-A15]|nr:ATP-binding protein [Acidobacteria bacterium AH-259-A15]